MNILDIQDKLKGLSQDQLAQEMQSPTGAVPQFLVLGEMNRRQSMRQAMQQQNVGKQTVAQELLSGAGIPAEGMTDMAQSMAPQSSIAQNTGISALPQEVPPPEQGGIAALAPEQATGMKKGGRVKHYQKPEDDNKSKGSERDRTERNFQAMYGIDDKPVKSADYEVMKWIANALNPVENAKSAYSDARSGDIVGAGLNAASMIPAGSGLSLLAKMGMQAAPSVYDDMRGNNATGMFAGGMVRKMAEGGGTARSIPMAVLRDPIIVTMASRKGMTTSQYLNSMPESDRQSAISNSLARAGRDSSSMFDIPQMAQANMSDAPFNPSRYTDQPVNPSYQEQTESVFAPDPEPVRNRPDYEDYGREGAMTMRERGDAARLPSLDDIIANDQAEYNNRIDVMMGSLPNMGERPPQWEDFYSANATNGVRPEFIPGGPVRRNVGAGPSFEDTGRGGIASLMDQSNAASALEDANYVPNSTAFERGGRGSGPQPSIAEQMANLPGMDQSAAREDLAYNVQNDRAGTQTVPQMAANLRLGPGPNRSGLNLSEKPYDMGPNSLAGLPDLMSGTVNIDSSGNISVEYPKTSSVGSETAPQTPAGPSAGYSIPEMLGRISPASGTTTTNTNTDGAGGAGGGSGGAGGGGAGGGGAGGGSGGGSGGKASTYEEMIQEAIKNADKKAKQDKWLALAQAGMALMSSNQSTLGGALGEAGTAGIASLQNARDTAEKTKLDLAQEQYGIDERKAAAARAAASDGKPKQRTTSGILSEITSIDNILGSMVQTDYLGEPLPLSASQQATYDELMEQKDNLIREYSAMQSAGVDLSDANQ